MPTIGTPGDFNHQINNPTSQSSGAAKAEGKVVKLKGKSKKSDPTPVDLKTDAIRSKLIRHPEEQGKTIIKPRFSKFKKGVGKIGESIASIKSFFKSAKHSKNADPGPVLRQRESLVEIQTKRQMEPIPPQNRAAPPSASQAPETHKPVPQQRPAPSPRPSMQQDPNEMPAPVAQQTQPPQTAIKTVAQQRPPGSPQRSGMQQGPKQTQVKQGPARPVTQQSSDPPTKTGIQRGPNQTRANQGSGRPAVQQKPDLKPEAAATSKPIRESIPDLELRKIAHQRCLDRFEFSNNTHNKEIIKEALAELNGFFIDIHASHLSADIKDILLTTKFASHYSEREKQILQEQATELQWVHDIGLQLRNAKGRGITNNVKPVTDAIINRVRSKAVESPYGVTIPGGIIGHAMMFQIKKNAKDGTYSFTILNSGLGLTCHHPHPSDKLKSQTSAIWSNLTLEQVSDRKLIDGILSCKAQNDVNQIYNLTKDVIGKRMDPPTKNQRLYHKRQLQGTCSNQVLHVLMHNTLPEPLYRKFKADLTSHTIDLFKEIKQAKPELDKAMLSEMQRVEERRKKKAEEARVKKKI